MHISKALWFADGDDCGSALKLLSIQRDQVIVQPLCQSNVDGITATYPMVGSDGSRPFCHRRCHRSQLDDT
jgi:hypothetical protein